MPRGRLPSRGAGYPLSPGHPGSPGSLGAEPQSPPTEPSLAAGEPGSSPRGQQRGPRDPALPGGSPGHSSRCPRQGCCGRARGAGSLALRLGPAPAAGGSDEEGGDGPAGAARRLPGAALGAGAAAGCCCPSPHGNDEQPVPPGTPSSCQQWPGEPQASGSPPGHLCEGPGWPGLACVPPTSRSGSRGHASSFGHGPELRWAREGSEQGAAPVLVAGEGTGPGGRGGLIPPAEQQGIPGHPEQGCPQPGHPLLHPGGARLGARMLPAQRQPSRTRGCRSVRYARAAWRQPASPVPHGNPALAVHPTTAESGPGGRRASHLLEESGFSPGCRAERAGCRVAVFLIIHRVLIQRTG